MGAPCAEENVHYRSIDYSTTRINLRDAAASQHACNIYADSGIQYPKGPKRELQRRAQPRFPRRHEHVSSHRASGGGTKRKAPTSPWRGKCKAPARSGVATGNAAIIAEQHRSGLLVYTLGSHIHPRLRRALRLYRTGRDLGLLYYNLHPVSVREVRHSLWRPLYVCRVASVHCDVAVGRWHTTAPSPHPPYFRIRPLNLRLTQKRQLRSASRRNGCRLACLPSSHGLCQTTQRTCWLLDLLLLLVQLLQLRLLLHNRLLRIAAQAS